MFGLVLKRDYDSLMEHYIERGEEISNLKKKIKDLNDGLKGKRCSNNIYCQGCKHSVSYQDFSIPGIQTTKYFCVLDCTCSDFERK